ncbi:hypothetical protein YQE_07171, partial [Dendroctonus ponderosae]
MSCNVLLVSVCKATKGKSESLAISSRRIRKFQFFSYSCMSEKAAGAVERAMDWNVSIIDGLSLARNNETINRRQARLLGFDRLSQAVQNFFQTHVIALELGGARTLGKDSGDMSSLGGGSGLDMKSMKKEKKYMSYAFMVLLGIFGLTGPLVMKVLAMMAAKSLLAAKAALIIVGSVALKKLFEKDQKSEPSVKVHTIKHEEDDHDRMSRFGMTGYQGEYNGQYYNSPYSSYYDDYAARRMNSR